MKEVFSVTFTYNGESFTSYRNLVGIETAYENKKARTHGFKSLILDGYNYDDFYKVADLNGAVADIYLLNEDIAVLPSRAGLCVYDHDVPLKSTGRLTYYSECCGKVVQSKAEINKRGYVISGPSQTKPFYCDRCKRDLKRYGNILNTEKNKYIDANGSWDFLLATTLSLSDIICDGEPMCQDDGAINVYLWSTNSLINRFNLRQMIDQGGDTVEVDFYVDYYPTTNSIKLYAIIKRDGAEKNTVVERNDLIHSEIAMLIDVVKGYIRNHSI